MPAKVLCACGLQQSYALQARCMAPAFPPNARALISIYAQILPAGEGLEAGVGAEEEEGAAVGVEEAATPDLVRIEPTKCVLVFTHDAFSKKCRIKRGIQEFWLHRTKLQIKLQIVYIDA